MGRPAVHAADRTTSIKFHLVRVPFIDGCYDRGGAYWGLPANLWRVRSAVEVTVEVPSWRETPERAMDHVEFFIRADSREDAKFKIHLPDSGLLREPGLGYVNATFFR